MCSDRHTLSFEVAGMLPGLECWQLRRLGARRSDDIYINLDVVVTAMHYWELAGTLLINS